VEGPVSEVVVEGSGEDESLVKGESQSGVCCIISTNDGDIEVGRG
jgi:hypothetical protein